MKLKYIFYGLLISGSLVSLGNYLWLIGIASKPEESLLVARWVYCSCIYTIAIMVGIAAHEESRGKS